MTTKKITASGKIRGRSVVLYWSEGHFIQSGFREIDSKIESLKTAPAVIAGTYAVGDESDPFRAIWVYQKIFDEQPELKYVGNPPTLPYKKGVIY